MRLSLLLAASAMCLLTSCATPEQLEAQRQAQMQADYNTCVNDYGFRPNSDGARNCMLQIELSRQQPRYYDYAPYPRLHGGYYYLRR